MMEHLRPAAVLLAFFTLLLGLAYPLAMTGIAQTVLPFQAAGSPVLRDGRVIGSALIGQNFIQDGYFHPRPSATASPYDAAASGGSNLGPLSRKLIDRISADTAALGLKGPVPADAVTTSASGLDPDISPANARSQVARVAAERGLSVADVAALVDAQTEGRLYGLIGEPHVDVLALNLALDKLAAK